MRGRSFLLPAILALVAVVVVAFFFLRADIPDRTSSSAQTSATAPRVAADKESFTFGETDSTSPASNSRKEDNHDLKALEAAVEPLRDNVVVSFGKVEDIGREAGYILPSLAEMRSLASTDSSKLSAEQRQRLLDLQRRYAGMLGMLPEIAGFQNNPEEYGKFFANMARQSAGLSESQAAQVDGYMRARADQMIQSGLNEANKPSDLKQMDAWESRRDQFNEQTVDGLRQVLSPQVADQAGINDQLMEFLETDFDKSGAQPGLH